MACFVVRWVSAAMLAVALVSCGDASAPIPRAASAQRAWMLSEAKSEDLLYVVNTSASSESVLAFSYPKGKLVGTIPGTQGAQTLCSDAAGNVYVVYFAGPSDSSGYVVEYAHGGTNPIATFADTGYYAGGCAVDPTTGDLAVANYGGTLQNEMPGNITIFPSNHSASLPYMDPQITSFASCTYDENGNLFAGGNGGSGLAELRKGGRALTNLTINQSIDLADWIQWDRHELAVSGGRGAALIYHLRIAGSKAIVTDSTLLEGPTGSTYAEFWIGGKTLVMAYGTKSDELNAIGFWKYPAGGYPFKTLSSSKLYGFLYGVTVSYASGK